MIKIGDIFQDLNTKGHIELVIVDAIGKTPGGYYAISSWKRKASQKKVLGPRKISRKKRKVTKRKIRARRRASGGVFMYRKGRKCVDARA